MSLQVLTGWKCKIMEGWIKLGNVQFPDKWRKENAKVIGRCLDCKKMIHRGETAFWLSAMQYLLHPKCGLGSKPISDLPPIYTENPTYDGNPFADIHKHTPSFYAAKELRDSRD